MIYLTGDLHGDLERFKSKEMKKLKKGDTLIVCGDFGFLWDGSKKEQSILKKLGRSKYQILFVEGTHDNLDLIAQYPLEDWNGGKARHIGGSLYKLERGSVFTLEGRRFFVFGGGESQEMDIRQADGTWWPQELPDEEEYHRAIRTLEEADKIVDVIITHTAPQTIIRMLGHVPDPHDQELTGFLEWVMHEVHFRKWYFGHWHVDQEVTLKITACWFDVHDIV